MEKRVISIAGSPELSLLGLNELIGKTGIIIEDLSGNHRRVKGMMVCFKETFLDEQVWFIPLTSIVYENNNL